MSDPWFKFYASDWLAGTRGLTAAETGVYVTLIAMMYERGEDIPRDDVRLSRLCGCPKASFTRALNALIDEGKVTEKDGGLSNDRVEKERQCRVEKSQKASVSASKRWASQADKTQQKQQKPDANAVNSQCDLDANQIPEPEPDKKDTNVSTKNDLFDANETAPETVRLPADWTPNDIDIEYALSKQIHIDDIQEMGRDFQTYWSELRTAKGRKSYKGWAQCWRNHVNRNAATFIRNRRMAGQTASGGYGQGGGIAGAVARRRAAN